MAKEDLLKNRALLQAAVPFPPEVIELNFRFMFGGMGAFARGRMFAVVLGTQVAFKLPPDQVEPALAAGGVPWIYEDRGRPTRMSTYIIMPASLIEDRAACADWMKPAIEYAMAGPPKKPRTRRKKA